MGVMLNYVPFISHQVLERNIYHIVEYIEWESRTESMNF